MGRVRDLLDNFLLGNCEDLLSKTFAFSADRTLRFGSDAVFLRELKSSSNFPRIGFQFLIAAGGDEWCGSGF